MLARRIKSVKRRVEWAIETSSIHGCREISSVSVIPLMQTGSVYSTFASPQPLPIDTFDFTAGCEACDGTRPA